MIAVYIMIGVAVYWLIASWGEAADTHVVRIPFPKKNPSPQEPPTHDPGEPPPS